MEFVLPRLVGGVVSKRCVLPAQTSIYTRQELALSCPLSMLVTAEIKIQGNSHKLRVRNDLSTTGHPDYRDDWPQFPPIRGQMSAEKQRNTAKMPKLPIRGTRGGFATRLCQKTCDENVTVRETVAGWGKGMTGKGADWIPAFAGMT